MERSAHRERFSSDYGVSREDDLKKLLPVLLILVAALAWWVYQRKSLPPEVPFVKARRETLVSVLTTNGKVEPIQWVTARAEIMGLVERVYVEQGQYVAEGAPLASLSASDAEAQQAAAEARAAQARADLAAISQGGPSQELAEIESGLVQAKFDRETAQKDLAALERLVAKQAATPAEVERARERVRQAELRIEALLRKRTALVPSTDRAVAEARVREAEAAAEQARRHIEQSTIRSPISGVAYDVDVRPGSYLNPGDAVASVGRLDRVRVRVYVDEPELGRVNIGQPVAITWDALPGKSWKGSVEKVPTEITPLGTRQVGEVLATIENEGNELVPGTNVNVEIQTSRVENALTIPQQALRRESNQAGVLLLEDSAVVWRPVKTGATSVTRLQVATGLADGDWVAMPSDQPLKPGDLVRPLRQQ
jgi:HlyD family secretion protein